MADIVGYIAAVFSTCALIPQVIKTLRTRSTGDISFLTFIAICTGGFLWLVYGIMLSSWPIIVANTIGFLLSFTVLLLKIRYG